MQFKNNNIRTKNKNMRCARKMWKIIFIMLTYANMSMKRIWQGYGARLCLKLMLKKIERNEESYFYLYPFGNLAQGGFYVCIK